MKKIMFNDKYGLTQAVLEGRKTMTRRIAEKVLVEDIDQHLVWTGEFKKPKYKVGEVVAVAQSYEKICEELNADFSVAEMYFDIPGWRNKMFVMASECIHQIRITNVRVERLQDITNEDCLKEGIVQLTYSLHEFQSICYSFDGDKEKLGTHKTARNAFAALIDKVSGKGAWEKNPYVFVYEFELVK